MTLAFFHIFGIFPSVNGFSNMICSGFLIITGFLLIILDEYCQVLRFSLPIALDTNYSVIVTFSNGSM